MIAPRMVITPKEQGYFDGACGFYAFHHAMEVLYPDDVGDKDFVRWLKLLSNDALPAAFLHGMSRVAMGQLIDGAMEIKKFNGLARSWPFWEKPATLDTFWEAVSDHLAGEGTSVILGLFRKHPDEEEWGHWTVIASASALQMQLIDSSGLRMLRKARTGILRSPRKSRERPYRIEAGSALFLRRG